MNNECLSESIYVNRPSLEDKILMIKHILCRMNVESEVSVEDIARIYIDESYSEVRVFLEKAYILSYMDGSNILRKKDIVQLFDVVNPYNLCEKQLKDECRYNAAYHEAAYVVVGELLESGITAISALTQCGTAVTQGITYRIKTLKYPHDEIRIDLAPIAAMKLGYECDKYSVITEWTKTEVRNCVLKYAAEGLDKILLMDSEEKHYSDFFRIEQKKAMIKILEESVEDAKKLIADHKTFYEAMADKLYKDGIILASEIQQLKNEVM